VKIPTIQGVIRRRLLLNYRVDPDVVSRLLPANFRPKTIDGHAIAGVCLIRLEEVRPKGLPAFAGIASENSAHRFAVTWEDADGNAREGVFVPRRDTDSRLNSWAGGRIFPGVHHHSRFRVEDRGERISLTVTAADCGSPLVEVEAEAAETLPESSVFPGLAEASRFFEAGCIGYSSRPDSRRLDGLRLEVKDWRVSPLAVKRVSSAYFDDSAIFPSDRIEFDHALLMRDLAHEWHAEPMMDAEDAPAQSAS
jgi:hypothetical protein